MITIDMFLGGLFMVELLKEEMKCLSRFRQEKIDVPLWSCIEGKMGRAWVDKKENPRAAVVIVADFCYLLGRPASNMADCKIQEVIENCKGKVIIIDDSSWVAIIESLYPNNLKRFSRYSIKKEFGVFQKSKLNSYIDAIASEFNIYKIDEVLYFKVIQDNFMADCCSNYSSLEDFLKNGIGYAIVHNGEVISAASSYSYCDGNIEVTIGTKDEYRRKGLALAAASRLILDCMERNIYPRWDAANLESVAVAEKLGYHFKSEYEAYTIS
jgi:hypothetical protein